MIHMLKGNLKKFALQITDVQTPYSNSCKTLTDSVEAYKAAESLPKGIRTIKEKDQKKRETHRI